MTRCDLLGPIVIFQTFAKCCVLRYYYYVGTGYGFFSSTAAHDLQIFTIAKICSPDKEIYKERFKVCRPSSVVVVVVVRRHLYLLSSHVSTLVHCISTFYCTYISFTILCYHVNTVQVLFNDYYELVFTLSRKYSTSTFY